MPASPTERSLAECRSRGWQACVVEKWIPVVKIRKDVWGFGDILALDNEAGAVLIQATTMGNMSARIEKIIEHCSPEAFRWLEHGNRIQVWGWAKRGPANKKRWSLRIVHLENVGGILAHYVDGSKVDG